MTEDTNRPLDLRRSTCLLHLHAYDYALTPVEVALVLGNSPAMIQAYIDDDLEQEALWSESALDDRDDPELAEVNLGEARGAAMSAQVKAAALRFVAAGPRRTADFLLVDELAAVQRCEREWLAVHSECDVAWNRTEECPDHGPAIRSGRARQAQAVAAMRERLRELATAQENALRGERDSSFDG